MDAPLSPISVRSNRRFHDTGFPEPFGGTSLPHPDANTSPNACISHNDFNIEQAMKRRRRSFLSKHKRTTSHGYCTPSLQTSESSQAIPTITPILTSSMSGHSSDEATRMMTSPVESNPRLSKEGIHDDALGQLQPELTPPATPDSSKSERRRSFLSKWRRN